MKKSRSSIPRFEARLDEEELPRPEGFEGGGGPREGAEEEEEEARVAIQVGMTKEGSEFPAKLHHPKTGHQQ